MSQPTLSQQNPSVSSDRASAAGLEFAFVQSCWHRDIVDRARDAFLADMAANHIQPDAISVFEVPGAFEIPLHVKKLARTGRYAAIVACGFVVDGGVYRHEFVADAVIGALMAVQLETEVPVISAVLTPHHFHDHDAHRRFFHEHFVVKGKEAASACRSTVAGLRRLAEIAGTRSAPRLSNVV